MSLLTHVFIRKTIAMVIALSTSVMPVHVLSRLSPGLLLDAAFGVQGTAALNLVRARKYGEFSRMAKLPDGAMLLLCAYCTEQSAAVMRLTPEGRLDTTYGQDGFVAVTGYIDNLSVLRDGSVLLYATNGPRLTKLTPSGSIDTSFGQLGSLDYSALGMQSVIALELSDRRILLAGAAAESGACGQGYATGVVALLLRVNGLRDPATATGYCRFTAEQMRPSRVQWCNFRMATFSLRRSGIATLVIIQSEFDSRRKDSVCPAMALTVFML